eukprot:5853-Heterococcus_DN1.PRE.4
MSASTASISLKQDFSSLYCSDQQIRTWPMEIRELSCVRAQQSTHNRQAQCGVLMTTDPGP